MQTQCCTEAHCSPLGYFTIQSAILRLLEAAAAAATAAAFRGSRLRSFVHCNVVKSLRFHYDYIVLSFLVSLSIPSSRCNPSPRPSTSRPFLLLAPPPPPPRLVFHFLILILLFRTRLVERYFVFHSFQSFFAYSFRVADFF